MDYKAQIRLNEALASEWNKASCIGKIGGMEPEKFLLLNSTAITKLLARAEEAEAKAEKTEEERDAAVDQLRGLCSACKHYTPYHNDGPCATCTHEVACFVPEKATDKWEWVGVKEE